jgi:hypothetical protein
MAKTNYNRMVLHPRQHDLKHQIMKNRKEAACCESCNCTNSDSHFLATNLAFNAAEK